MANNLRLGVHSRHAIRLGVRPRSSVHRKAGVRHHTFRRLSGVGGGAANFHTAKARAANHARLSARAKAKAAIHTALMRSPARIARLRASARAAALQKAAARTAQLRSPARLASLRASARAAALAKAHPGLPSRGKHAAKAKHATRPKAPRRPAKPKQSASGAPISAQSYISMF